MSSITLIPALGQAGPAKRTIDLPSRTWLDRSQGIRRESESRLQNGHTQSMHGTDQELLSRVRARQPQAMGELYDRFSSLVYSISLRVLRDPAAAEDVLQEVFMHVWKDPEAYVANRGSLCAWLAVVARNRSIDHLRRRRPEDSVEDVILPDRFNLADSSERSLLLERVRSVLGTMPPEQRKAIEMAFFEGLTHSEIAEMTGDPLGTVKTRIRSALIVIRKALHA